MEWKINQSYKFGLNSFDVQSKMEGRLETVKNLEGFQPFNSLLGVVDRRNAEISTGTMAPRDLPHSGV